MNEKQENMRLSDEIIIEIVHGIKEILIELIDRAFPKGTDSSSYSEGGI